MSFKELLALLVTIIGVTSFSFIFTILFKGYVNSILNEINKGSKDIEIIGEKIKEKKKNNKRRKIIKLVLFYSIIIIITPILVISLINKINGNSITIANKMLMVVASDSMSVKNEANEYLINLNNQFNTFDIIVLEKVKDDSNIKINDVIAYKNGKVNIIHRVVEIKELNGEIRYITRGDKYDKNDIYQPSLDDVIGIYTSNKINYLGIFIMFFQSYIGLITIISIIYCLLMVDYFNKKILSAEISRFEIIKEAIGCDCLYFEGKSKEAFCYKGFVYTFTEKGLIDKKEIIDDNKTSINITTNELKREELE